MTFRSVSLNALKLRSKCLVSVSQWYSTHVMFHQDLGPIKNKGGWGDGGMGKRESWICLLVYLLRQAHL